MVVAGVLCALLPPPYHAWALLAWLSLAFLVSPIRVWRWQFWLLIAAGLWSFAAAVIPYTHTGKWTQVVQGVGLALSGTLAVQAYPTLQASLLLAVGILCAIWFLGQSYSHDSLKKILRGILMLLIILSGVAAVALAMGWKNPAFATEEFFTFFANRNQSASLYAFTALIAVGLWRLEKRPQWRQLCIAGLIVGIAALAFSPSRGGWMTLALGVAVVLSGSRRGIITAVALLILTSLLVVIGLPGWDNRPTSGQEVRPTLFSNTIEMIGQNPLGVGAGNFRYIFPHYQTANTAEQIVIQPENDWLWMWAELGPLCLLLPLAFFTLRWESHRRGKIVAGMLLGLLAVSIVDTPLHRLGMIILILACLGPVLAIPVPNGRRAPLWPALVPLGLLAWMVTLHLAWQQPRTQMRASLSYGNLELTRHLGEKLTTLIPLDFAVYQELGIAELNWSGSKNTASGALQKALALQPTITAPSFQVGFAWRNIDKNKALSAWRESLRRAQDDEKLKLFSKIIRDGNLTWADLMGLCARDKELWVRLLSEARPSDMSAMLEGMRRQNMDFWQLPEAKTWARKAIEGSPYPLSFLGVDPTPLPIQALYNAQQRDYRRAYALGRQAVQPGQLVDAYPQVSKRELAIRLKLVPDQAAAYLEALAVRALAENDQKSYYDLLAQAAMSRGASPAVLGAYADRLMETGKWPESWQQLYKILFAEKKPL